MDVINILGGPGTGKSVLLAKVFAKLKIEGVICDMIPEIAKKLTYEKRLNILEQNQHYIFSKQLKDLRTLGSNNLDVVITDGSLVNSIVYSNEDNPHFIPMVLHEFKKYNNYTFYLTRETIYQPSGRRQSEESAKLVDNKTIEVLEEFDIDYTVLNLEDAESVIVKTILNDYL